MNILPFFCIQYIIRVLTFSTNARLVTSGDYKKPLMSLTKKKSSNLSHQQTNWSIHIWFLVTKRSNPRNHKKDNLCMISG